MKKLFTIFVLIAAIGAWSGASPRQESETQPEQSDTPEKSVGTAELEDELVIYAYDSFVSEWGPAPVIIPKFEEKYGVDVIMQSPGDAGQVLSRAILEKNNPKADVVIGVDNNLLARALDAGVFTSYKPESIENIPRELVFDPTYHVTPYDYGYFAIIYDDEVLAAPPENLEELTAKRFEESLILMDPRTSTPGLGFLLWTVKVYGEDYLYYWERLAPSILTITEGWDAGYGLFTSGEAPLVLSYTTSPAYHVEYEDSTRYKAALFEEGHYMQIEGMGITNGAPHPRAAEKFLDFALTEAFQSEIPLTNWMYPVNPGVELPESFEYAQKPDQSLMIDPPDLEDQRETLIQDWASLMSRELR